jgi:hypothetical protein
MSQVEGMISFALATGAGATTILTVACPTTPDRSIYQVQICIACLGTSFQAANGNFLGGSASMISGVTTITTNPGALTNNAFSSVPVLSYAVSGANIFVQVSNPSSVNLTGWITYKIMGQGLVTVS